MFIPTVVGSQVVFLKVDDPDLQTALIYDSGTGQWSSVRLAGPRSFLSAVATVGSRLLLAGGAHHPADVPREVQLDIPVDSVDLFDSATGSWAQARLSRPCAFSDAAVALVGMQVLLAGCNTVPVTRIEVYDASASGGDAWRTTQLSQARTRMAVAVVGTQALFAGGVQGYPGVSVDTVDRYDGATGTWTTAALSSPRQVANVAVVGNQALFIGGWMQPDRVAVGPLVDVYTSDAP